MRIHPSLLGGATQKNARRPQKEPVPFQMLLPLQLKKTVSGKGDKLKEAACMQEMALMFACFKKSDFNQQECLKEVAAFQGCYNEYNKRMTTQREQGKKGILVPGEKKLTHRQLNQLMRSFPPK
ncbi:unnamed protein product [Arctia plantaginis]|uniref:CHCH domain-containing protein n=1 Tax=Arctia plantaginis TaxID=874455 RepID=A0A8S0ZNZ2_ARCPL|nr:unnamed protein product [Arctia plantaginis]CAB3234822.1 unnamed protein product [Arctia plantaginis]